MVNRSPSQQSQISQAIEYIKSHWHEGKTLKEIAVLYGVDAGNLARRFRFQEGVTVKKYADSKRAEYVQSRVLRNHTLGYELANELGFASDFAFYRWVKRVFGIPFSELRRSSVIDKK